MHLSGALYIERNSKPGKKADKTTLKPNSGESSHVTVSEQNNASDGSAQPPPSHHGYVAPSYRPPDDSSLPPRRHSSTARNSDPFVPTSLNGILEDEDKPPRRRESAPFSKPTKPSSGRNSSPSVTSLLMGRGRSHSIGELSGIPSDIVRTGSASPRRSSLFSPDSALADDENDVTGW